MVIYSDDTLLERTEEISIHLYRCSGVSVYTRIDGTMLVFLRKLVKVRNEIRLLVQLSSISTAVSLEKIRMEDSEDDNNPKSAPLQQI